MIENATETILETSETLRLEVELEVNRAVKECEAQFLQLRSEAAEREAWAAQRLGVA